MTPPAPARSATCDIPAVHAAIAQPSALQPERRALYQLAAELLECGGSWIRDPDILDSPVARNRIGDALAGRGGLVCSELVGISALASASGQAGELRVASRPEANILLAAALDNIGAELGRQQAAPGSPGLLTEADTERFASALVTLHDGVALARSASPELLADLLTHVALVAILDPQRIGRLVSASSRSFPGLVLLTTPSSIDVAEGLVHEGAHQKLFDLAITHDLFNADSGRCPPFHPPWAQQDILWPIEQTLAACHAYACLNRFAHDVGVTSGTRVGDSSLLPVANERCEILGQWLLGKGNHLGSDAHTLLQGLLGQPPRTGCAVADRSGSLAAGYDIDDRLELRRCGSSGRVLVGCPSQPPQLYWVSEDAATLLELIGHKPLNEVVDTLAQRWKMPHGDVTNRLTRVLSDLSATGLVTPKGHLGTGL